MGDLAPPNSTRHCSTLLQNYKMSQKSITSFFVRKAPLSTSSTSDGDGSKNSPSPVKKVKSPIEKKEKTPKEKKVKTPVEKKVKTPFEKKDQKSIISEEKAQVQSSPLREANQIQDDNEASLDSPIKKTKVTARKRIEPSSDEENGSPKKESPEKPKTAAKKRKSSPVAKSKEKP